MSDRLTDRQVEMYDEDAHSFVNLSGAWRSTDILALVNEIRALKAERDEWQTRYTEANSAGAAVAKVSATNLSSMRFERDKWHIRFRSIRAHVAVLLAAEPHGSGVCAHAYDRGWYAALSRVNERIQEEDPE